MAPSTAVVFVLPLSPSETNPPLGPAILARAARNIGATIFVRDLNIIYLRQFYDVDSPTETASKTLGDQGRDRSLAARASFELFSQFNIDPSETLFVPDDVANPEPGMHFTEAGIDRAIDEHLASESSLVEWISSRLDEFESEVGVPDIVGASLMGPAQVFPSLLLLRLAKRRWKNSVTVLGGSHVTLLAGSKEGARLIEKSADAMFPGHSEENFAGLLVNGVPVQEIDHGRASEFEYEPLFEPEQLALYQREKLALPVQFSRGCVYAKCTYCTYPIVEPVATRIDVTRAADTLRSISAAHGVRQFSLKDSLVPQRDLLALARAFRSQGLSATWSATTLPKRVLGTIADELAAGGLRTLEFGVESIHAANQELFRKRCSPEDVEWMIDQLARVGVVSVVNLMFGFPGETEKQADEQLTWASMLKQRHGTAVDFSLNMLEVVRGSPMERDRERFGIVGAAPWAFAYEWRNFPPWRKDFAPRLVEMVSG